jgi:glutamate-1-semialdehyde aminotransferase
VEVTASEAVLRHVAPWATRVRSVRTGSESVTAAVMVARVATGRRPVLVAEGSYHGWHPWTSQRGLAGTDGEWTLTYEYGRISDIPRLVAQAGVPAAIVVEPARWQVTPDGYLQALQEEARRLGALFVVDEMIYGGRWALGGATQLHGLVPDLACFGKALGNGAAVAFLVGGAALAEHGELVSGTYSGDSGALGAARETIDTYVRRPVIEVLWERGAQLQRGMWAAIELAGWSGEAFWEGVGAPHQRLRFRHAPLGREFSTEMAARGVLWHPDLANVCFAHTKAQVAEVCEAALASLHVLLKHHHAPGYGHGV